MLIRYHYMEPGEDIALVRMAREGASNDTVHIVITLRESDFRELVHTTELKAALLDYDGTFTRIGNAYSHAHKREEKYQTGWQELRRRLPVEGHRDLDRHYALYKRGDITPLEWLYISVACYQRFGLSLEDVLETAGRVPFRTGWESFTRTLRTQFEKRFILSFGLREWIDTRPEFSEFDHETVASDLILDAQNKIEGVRAGITEDTKGTAALALLRRHGWEPRNAFAIGNSWHDRHLFSAAAVSVYLSHGGYKGAGINHEAEIERLKSVATAIVFDDTLVGAGAFLDSVLSKEF